MNKYVLTAFATIICVIFNAQAPVPLTMSFFKGLVDNPTYIFVSNKSDTSKFIVDGTRLSGRDNQKRIQYNKITKDTNYYSSYMEVDTFYKIPPRITIYFEGCIADANSKTYDKQYKFKNTDLSDVGEFEVMHDNYNYFPNEKKGVKKVWWSASVGLLKYETRDGITWIRIK